MEEWREIPGLSRYQASSLGRIRGPKKVLDPKPGGYGYIRIAIYPDGTSAGRRYVNIHRLVAAAFIGPLPSENMQINHIDGVKTNNRPDNLEYVTPKQNQAHASMMGLKPHGDDHWTRQRPPATRGSKNGFAKTSEQQVLEIRKLAREGFSSRVIAKRYGLCGTTVRSIVNNETWRHVQTEALERANG